MAEYMDDRYATFREHAELRERTATLEATVQQIPTALARIETMVASRLSNPQQHVDHSALALQRALDELSNLRTSTGQQLPPWLLVLAAIGLGALGYALRFLTGG